MGGLCCLLLQSIVVPGPKTLLTAMPGSIALLQLGSVVMSMTLAQRTLEPHWPWDGWPFPLLGMAAGELALSFSGELTPALRKDDGPSPHLTWATH